MSLRNKIDEDYKQSIKSKDKQKTDTLRLIRSAIKDKDISSRTSENKESEQGMSPVIDETFLC